MAFAFEQHLAPYLARGELVRGLDDWCPPVAGDLPYDASRRQQPRALAALIDALRV